MCLFLNTQISSRAVATTRLYIKRLRLRFGVSNRSQLVLRAIELGLHPAATSPSLN